MHNWKSSFLHSSFILKIETVDFQSKKPKSPCKAMKSKTQARQEKQRKCLFFVTKTSTHPNPHCELQRRGQGSTTPFRTQYRQGPPNLTLSSEYTSELQSRHWSGGFVDFVMGLSGFAWICWRRRVLIVGEEEFQFKIWMTENESNKLDFKEQNQV